MFSVPEYSQYLDTDREEWKSEICGVVCLKMVFDYLGLAHDASIDELTDEGVRIGAYKYKPGWYHKGLVSLAQNHGMNGNAYDWADKSGQEAFDLLRTVLRDGPVIASVYPRLNPENGSGHLVVIVGIENGIVFYNDPAAKIRENIKRSATIEDFIKGWKKRAILISKRN